MATTLIEIEREKILDALLECGADVKLAAKKLAIDQRTLRSRMIRHGIDRQELSGLRHRPAVKEEETKTFAEEKQQRIERIQKGLPNSEKVYGSIGYIARTIFKGEENMVGYARMVAEDGDTRFQAFVAAWEKERGALVPKGARKSLLTVLKDVDLNSIDFCVEVMRACMKRNIEMSNIYAGLAHPAVVKRNIKSALLAKGVKDREMFLQHSGWLPLPKGSTVNVNAQAAAGLPPSNVPVGTGIGEGTERTPLPEFEEMTVEGSKIVRREFEE
jgi:hypothetical protein